MSRRLFLKTIGIVTVSHVLPGFAAELPAPTVPPLDSASLMTPSIESARDLDGWGTDIRVVGVGGAGSNALDQLIRAGVQNVEFIAMDTDAQSVARNLAPAKVRLGRTGLGTGAKPELGRAAAEDSEAEIRTALNGAHMVFIAASMGGGTGTGASSVIAKAARELGILTVGVVTKPFAFEGSEGLLRADAAIAELSEHIDSLIVISHERLLDELGNNAEVNECFCIADDMLKNTVTAIADMITCPSLVGVDFEDVRTVMGNGGRAKMGSAISASGNRACNAAEQAIAELFMDADSLSHTSGVLFNVTAAKPGFKMKEILEVINTIKGSVPDDTHIIFGAVYDEAMGDALRVTVFATGLDRLVGEQPNLEVRDPESGPSLSDWLLRQASPARAVNFSER